MATRQYIGARYIPVFADPVEWDDTRPYEYLTMVQHEGETYMSKQNVPIGAPLPDISQDEESTEYWVHMSNWNAQVEAYRQEVLTYNGRISTLEDDLPITEFNDTNTVKAAIDGLADIIPASSFDDDNTVSDAISAVGTEVQAVRSTTTKSKTILVFGDSWGSTDAASISARDNGHTYVNRIKLLENDRIFNFCDGGAGFADTSSNVWNTNFTGQISHASADTHFEDSDVTDVIVFGGINDVGSGYTAAQVRSAAITFIETAQATFTNARIVVIGANTRRAGNQTFYDGILSVTKALSKVTTEYACEFYPALTWLIGDSSCWASDNYHPNNHGGYILAAFIGGIIYGKKPSYIVDYQLGDVKVGGTDVTHTVRAGGEHVSFDMFDGTIGGCFDIDVTYSASSGAKLFSLECAKDSPFIYNNVAVTDYVDFSTSDFANYDNYGSFTGNQNGTSYDVMKLYNYVKFTGSASIIRMQLTPSGRVF